MDPLRQGSLKRLMELSEEGAAQLYRPLEGSAYIIGALGVLQFDVLHGLENEYRVRARFESVPFTARRTSNNDESLKKFIKENQSRIYTDIAEQYSFIAQSDWAVGYAEEQYPDVQFHKTMEI